MNDYSEMQYMFYDEQAKKWETVRRNPLVGSFDDHNNWKDYEYLFDGFSTKGKVALDFGCGVGRAIALYWHRFDRIDGADISQEALNKVQVWLDYNHIQQKPTLYKTNGKDLRDVPSDTYDIVYSTITLQHICVHDIRFTILQDIFRVLKSGGWFTAQMGYGKHPESVGYYENFNEATVTNGGMDTRIEDISNLESDLEKIGFINCRYVLGNVGPGDKHDKWIYFRAKKP